MRFLITRKKIAALAVVGTLSVGGVVAYAYWSNSGSGSGKASTGSVTAGSIKITDDNAAVNLGPGYPAHAVNLTFQNVDQYDEYVTSVTVTLSDATTGSSCATSNWAINGVQYSGPVVVPIGLQLNTGAPIQTKSAAFTIGMFETNSNQAGCESQSPAVNIAYSSN